MSGIVNQLINAGRKLGTYVLEYSCIALQWKLKFLRTRAQGWSRCSARKRLEKVCSDLGMEVYSAYKQSQSGWESNPSIQQQIRSVEEAEMGLFSVDDSVRQIQEAYEVKKEAIHEAYAARRAAIDRGPQEQ